jgi:hypothetical protein
MVRLRAEVVTVRRREAVATEGRPVVAATEARPADLLVEVVSVDLLAVAAMARPRVDLLVVTAARLRRPVVRMGLPQARRPLRRKRAG